MDLYNKRQVIHKLLSTSSYGEETKQEIEKWVETCEDSLLLSKAIKKLQDHQLDKIAYGFNYTTKDIIEHIKKIT